MPTLAATVTSTSTQVVKLSPALRKKLLTRLKTYLGLKGQEKVIKAAMKKGRSEIEEVLEEAGQTSLSIDGMKASLVSPIRKVFNPKKFVALGGNLDHYNGALDEVPGTPWVKISDSNSKDEEDE